MSWTYTGNPATRTLDAVRFLIGDTNEDTPQLQDEEINWLLTQHGSARNAAIGAARALAAKYAGLVDKAVGDLRLSLSQKHKQYLDLVAQLESSASLLAVPFAGGISVADVAARNSDSDRVKPAFTRDLHEYAITDDDDD